MAVVYRHIRKDTNMPFYVGIGMNKKRAYATYHRSNHWKNITSITEYDVHILFDDVDYDWAKQKEIELISLYKRIIDGGTLCNLTLGGDGCTGIKHSDASRRLIGSYHKGKSITSEHKKAISRFHTGKLVSVETRKKQSDAMKNYYKTAPKRSSSKKQKLAVSKASSGSKNKMSKLTELDIPLILEMRSNGKKVSEIKTIFAVSKGTILNIINNKTWKHIDRTWKKQNH